MNYSWVSPKLVMKESPIEGHGFFAQEVIAKDELLIVQGGQCLHIEEVDAANLDDLSYMGFQVEERVYIIPIIVDGEPQIDGIFGVNHSCNPNAGISGQITLLAMRKIERGEEITFDYAMTDIQFDGDTAWDEMACSCMQQQCRKEITGSDWKLSVLQERYKGYFSAHVRNAISQLTRRD